MHPGNALAVESWAAVVDRLDADETGNSTVDNTHRQG